MRRLGLVIVTLLLACGLQRTLAAVGTAAPPPSLRSIPAVVGLWHGRDETLSPEVLAALRVDDYLFRRYAAPGRTPLTLYLAYYGRERLDERVHSPSACLPAGGWLPVSVGRQVLSLRQPPYRVEVNRDLVQRGAERQEVLYWFQGRGRIVADDIKATFYLGFDTLAGRGSEETLVRVNAPVQASADAVLAEESQFVRLLYRELARVLGHR